MPEHRLISRELQKLNKNHLNYRPSLFTGLPLFWQINVFKGCVVMEEMVLLLLTVFIYINLLLYLRFRDVPDLNFTIQLASKKPFQILFFLLLYFLKSSFRFRAKLRGVYRDFPEISCPYTFMVFPIISIPHQEWCLCYT